MAYRTKHLYIVDRSFVRFDIVSTTGRNFYPLSGSCNKSVANNWAGKLNGDALGCIYTVKLISSIKLA